MSVPRLETERLVLRGWEERDLDPYAEITADRETMRFMGRGPFDRQGAWREIALYVGHQELRGYTHWALEERATGALVGRCGPWFPEGWPALEIGWLLDRAHWGRGLATEAARAAREWIWRELDPPRLISLVHPENARSARVAERLGARRAEDTEVLGMPTLVFEHPRPGAG